MLIMSFTTWCKAAINVANDSTNLGLSLLSLELSLDFLPLAVQYTVVEQFKPSNVTYDRHLFLALPLSGNRVFTVGLV